MRKATVSRILFQIVTPDAGPPASNAISANATGSCQVNAACAAVSCLAARGRCKAETAAGTCGQVGSGQDAANGTNETSAAVAAAPACVWVSGGGGVVVAEEPRMWQTCPPGKRVHTNATTTADVIEEAINTACCPSQEKFHHTFVLRGCQKYF